MVKSASFSQSLLELCNGHCFPEKMASIFLHFHQFGMLLSKKKNEVCTQAINGKGGNIYAC